ncbi:MAG: HAD-IIB family hydrolase [Sandaracinaceae bacterium]|nr:HAD-IIB family hydrolase [Sandaracinaceae bacterium]
MLPLDHVSTEALRGLRGLCFDIDDTVTRGGKLQPEAFAAMWRLHAAGVRLIAVTGRPLGWANVVARHWPVDVAIGENGAGWYPGAHHRAPGIPPVGFFDDAETRAQQDLLLQRVERAVKQQMPHVFKSNDQGGRLCDLAFDVGEEAHLPASEIRALVQLIEAEGARVVVSSVHAHVVPGDWNKARGIVRAARELLGEDVEAAPERWAFIGDSGNDAAAFAYFPLSFGVANVRDQFPLVHEPRYVTQAPRGEGFAELADAILAARASSPRD